MKSKIVIATLPGCSKCKSLIDKLNEKDLEYVNVPCDKDPKMCDQIESLVKTSLYPMVIVKDTTQNLNYIYFNGFDYNELGKEKEVAKGVIAVPVFSPEELIKKLEKHK